MCLAHLPDRGPARAPAWPRGRGQPSQSAPARRAVWLDARRVLSDSEKTQSEGSYHTHYIKQNNFNFILFYFTNTNTTHKMEKWSDWESFHGTRLDVRIPDITLSWKNYFHSEFFRDGSFVEIRRRNDGKPSFVLMPPMHYKLKQTEPWWDKLRRYTLDVEQVSQSDRDSIQFSPELFLASSRKDIHTVTSSDEEKCGCNDLNCRHCDNEDSEIDQLEDEEVDLDISDDSDESNVAEPTLNNLFTQPGWTAEAVEVNEMPVTAEEVTGTSNPLTRKRKASDNDGESEVRAIDLLETSPCTNTIETRCKQEVMSQNWYTMQSRIMKSYRRYTDKEMQFLADNIEHIDSSAKNTELKNEILLYLQTKNIQSEKQVCNLNSRFYVMDGYPTSGLEYNRRRRWRCLTDNNTRITPYTNTRCREVKEHCSCNLHAPVDLLFLLQSGYTDRRFCHFCFTYYDDKSNHFKLNGCRYSNIERPLYSEQDKLKLRGKYIRTEIAKFIEGKNQKIGDELMPKLAGLLTADLLTVLAGLSKFRSSHTFPREDLEPNTATNFDAYLTSINYAVVRSEAHVVGQFWQHFARETQMVNWNPGPIMRLDPAKLPEAEQCINIAKDINFCSLKKLFDNLGLLENYAKVYTAHKNTGLSGLTVFKICNPEKSKDIQWDAAKARKALMFYKGLLNTVLKEISTLEHNHTIHLRNCVVNPSDPVFVLPTRSQKQTQQCGCDETKQILNREVLQRYNKLACFYAMLARQITTK